MFQFEIVAIGYRRIDKWNKVTEVKAKTSFKMRSISSDKTSSQANRPLIQQQIMHIAWVITNWVWICIGKWFFSHFLGLARGESISCWFNFNYYSIKCQSHSFLFRFSGQCVFMFLGSNSKLWHTRQTLSNGKKNCDLNRFFLVLPKTPAAMHCIVAFFRCYFKCIFQLLCHYSNRHKRLWTH